MKMRKMELSQMERVQGGSRSYGAGLMCGLFVVGTLVSVAAGPPGLIAMGSVTGSICAGSIWHAWDEK